MIRDNQMADEDDEFVPKIYRASTPDGLARGALLQMLASLSNRLHDAIEDDLDSDALHDIVGLWEANNINDELTYENLVEWGKPSLCDDCSVDVTPHDQYGSPFEGGWEWYMVRDEIWSLVNAGHEEETHYLCIGCLEGRLGRGLTARDFADLEVNEPSPIYTRRLLDRLSKNEAA